MFMVYAFFSTSELYDWKTTNPPFFGEATDPNSLLETVFIQDIRGCQQILATLFMAKEQETILLGSRKLPLWLGGRTLPDIEGQT